MSGCAGAKSVCIHRRPRSRAAMYSVETREEERIEPAVVIRGRSSLKNSRILRCVQCLAVKSFFYPATRACTPWRSLTGSDAPQIEAAVASRMRRSERTALICGHGNSAYVREGCPLTRTTWSLAITSLSDLALSLNRRSARAPSASKAWSSASKALKCQWTGSSWCHVGVKLSELVENSLVSSSR